MSSHRPKSLSELNNVYDKALRAEKAIKESSSLLSIPEQSETQPSENIFLQLETKANEARKNQVFDPDITNIASDFLKRYAQPEKPKAVPKEIKRPAPTIQSVQPHVKKHKPEVKADEPDNFIPVPETKSDSVPLHRPSHNVPSTDAFVTSPQTIVSAQASVPAYAEPVAEDKAVYAPVAIAPKAQAPAVKRTPVKTAPAPIVDHTPRPAPSRVRITSTERNELMEEYMRVMSDDDDEPTEKKSVFSFFRKKKHNDYDDEPVESIYEDLDEEEDSASQEVPVVAFDSSDVRYEDEYSYAPAEDNVAEASSQMDLYDYIEADFDYDEDEDGTLDVSTTTFEKEDVATETAYEEVAEEAPETEAEADDTAETLLYPAEEESPEINEEPEAEAAEEEAEAEETVETEVYAEEAVEVAEVQEEIVEAEEVIEVQEEIVEAQEIEEIVSTEEIAEETAEASQEAEEYTPPAEMEFEDIFSVTDESKRSHTGGDWGGTVPPAVPSYESEKQYTQKSDMYDGYDDYDDYDYETEDYPEKKKGNVLLKVVLVLFAVLSLTLGTATAAMDILIDIDSGKLISDTYRLFCAKNDMPMFDINKGDLLVVKNAHIDTDDVYVYASPDNTYSVGKVLAITENSEGDSVLSTESQEGEQLITRDRSMGILISSYSVIGTVLSILCNYGIFMAVAFALIAVALIVLLVIISKKKSEDGYISGDSSYDDSDDDYYGDDSSDGYSEEDDDEEYYSEYDTDGIEEGLFSGI